MIKLIELLKEVELKNNLVEDAKTLSQDEFLKKYSNKIHGYVSIDDKGEPFIRINDEIIPVTPSEDWAQYEKKYDTLYPILLTYTREYDDAQVQDARLTENLAH